MKVKLADVLDELDLPQAAWEVLSRRPSTAVAVAAARRCPTDLRDELIDTGGSAKVRNVALSRSGLDERLREAAASKVVYVASGAAANPNTPADTLARLAGHRHPRVVRAALMNPNTPGDACADAADRWNAVELLSGGQVLMAARAEQIADHHHGTILRWVDHHRLVRQVIARRLDSGDAMYERLAAERSNTVAATLAANPAVAGNVLRKRHLTARDRQHRRLFERVDEHLAAARAGNVAVLDLLSPTLDRLLAANVRQRSDFHVLAQGRRVWPDAVALAWTRVGSSADERLVRGRLAGHEIAALRQLHPQLRQPALVPRDLLEAVRLLGDDRARWELYLSLEPGWEGTLVELAVTTGALS